MSLAFQTQDLSSFAANFEWLEKQGAANGQAWIHSLRQAGYEQFKAQGLPTVHHEEWRQTNLAGFAREKFELAAAGDVTADQVEALSFDARNSHSLVFVDGHYHPQLSVVGDLPAGTCIGSLRSSLDRQRALVEPHLGHHARAAEQPFAALNQAFLRDGAFIYVPSGKVLDRPVHLLFVSTEKSAPAAVHPRVLIVAGENSQVRVVESYVGLDVRPYFVNPVVEIVVGQAAVVDHYKVQREGRSAYHISVMNVYQERQSAFTTNSVSLGGSLVRNDLSFLMDGEGSQLTLRGLFMVEGQQHADNHTFIDHAQPHCSSRENYKGILDGRATGVFSGHILVRQDAQKTDARQTNKNLILSQHATVDTKPQFKIFADDVKCTHGATIGQLDRDAMFYLQSRGIGRDQARNLLTYAFASEIVDEIAVEAIRLHLRHVLETRLSLGETTDCAWRSIKPTIPTPVTIELDDQ